MALTASGPGQKPIGDYSPIDRFRAAFTLAYIARDADLYGPGTPEAPTVQHATLVGYDREYLETGFSLVRANCEDYFEREGRLQQTANVFRDLNNSFLPIASGALAIASSGGSAAGVIALLGAANNGVLNAVYKNFLFDSANIASVHDLVNAALTTNEAKVYANLQTSGTSISFDWVTRQILTEQSTCQPANILQLAQAAIATAKPSVDNVPGSSDVSSTDGVPVANAKDGAPAASIATLPPPPSTLPVQITSGSTTRIEMAQTSADKEVAKKADTPTRRLRLIGSIKDDPSKIALMACLYPGAAAFRGGAGYDAAGHPVALNAKAHAAVNAWLQTVNLRAESILELLAAPDQAAFRIEAVRVNCGDK